MGSNAIITSPSLLALLPLVLYIVLMFIGKGPLVVIMISIVIGAILTGQTPSMLADLIASSLSSSIGVIGFIMILGSGLGKVMNDAGISQTLVYYTCRVIGINSKRRVMICIIVSTVLICGLLGTLAGGCAVLAPVLIPIAAAVGLNPSVVGALMQTAGCTGLIWGPFASCVIATMACTGLSYGKMMLYAAIPYGMVSLVTVYFCGHIIQKKTTGIEKYELGSDEQIITSVDPTSKRATVAFSVAFLLLFGYAVATSQGVNYTILVLLILTIVVAIASKKPVSGMFKTFAKGMGSLTELFLLLVLINVMLSLVEIGGGFEALGNLIQGPVMQAGPLGVMFGGAALGAFGITGGTTAEIYLLTDLFSDAITATGLPMQMWAVALIVATRITTNLIPSNNMLGSMGLARSNNLKMMLFAGWVVSAVNLLFMVIYGVVGIYLFS